MSLTENEINRAAQNLLEAATSVQDDCGICLAFCQKEAIVLDEEETSSRVHPEKSVNCGFC